MKFVFCLSSSQKRAEKSRVPVGFLIHTTATVIFFSFFYLFTETLGLRNSDARRGLATVRALAHTQISERRVPVRTELLYERAPGGGRDGGNTWAPQTY